MHWGEENINYPLRSQKMQAKELIDNGADLIVGTHPHVIQGHEKYKGKYVFYSLGNFFFPETEKQKKTKNNKISIIPFFDEKLELIKIITTYQNKNNKIKLINKNDKLKKLSKKLNSKYYQLLILKELIKRDFIKPLINKMMLK